MRRARQRLTLPETTPCTGSSRGTYLQLWAACCSARQAAQPQGSCWYWSSLVLETHCWMAATDLCGDVIDHNLHNRL